MNRLFILLFTLACCAEVSAQNARVRVGDLTPLERFLGVDARQERAANFEGSALPAGRAPMEGIIDSRPNSGVSLMAHPADTSWDDRFDSICGLNNSIYSMAVGGTDIYVGGLFTKAGSDDASCIARWDGSAWHGLGPGLDNNVRAIVLNGGELYASGQFTRAGELTVNGVARWDGTRWHPLGSGMNGIVYALAFYGGDLYAGGLFTMAGGVNASNIARWDGASWHAIGSGMNSYVFAFALRAGALIAAGDFTTANGDSAYYIASWNGTAWSTLGSGLDSYVFALATSGTDVIAGGNFITAGGVVSNRLARWDGSSWSSMGDGVNDYIFSLTVDGSAVYAGGYLTLVGGTSAQYVAKFESGSWAPLGSGTNGYCVFALGVRQGSLYLGGTFTMAGEKTSMYFGRWGAAPRQILAAAGPGGAIFPSGVVKVENGMDVNFHFRPRNGMHVDSIMVDGLFAGDSASFRFRGVGGDHTIRVAFGLGGEAVVLKLPVRGGWNMVSVPLTMQDYARTEIFGAAISSAYAFKGIYTGTDSLENGAGYWVKFADNGELELNGIDRAVDSFKVLQGWNLVGSASVPIPVKEITTIPGGMAASRFYAFADAYAVAETIQPGQGYWVKVDQSGTLILSATPSMENANKIRIVETSELPPSPPRLGGESGGPMPTTYALGQNYPNPFNPSTTITYALPAAGRVKLAVFNALGQPIATLVDGIVTEGLHEVVWNASASPSGIYYYRLNASELSTPAKGFKEVKKLMLVK